MQNKTGLALSNRRERVLLVFLALAIAGVALLCAAFGWYLWRQSVVAG